MEIHLVSAQKHHALAIARLIMQAMNYECCKNFMGPGHTLDEFERMMNMLVLREDSQYSYRNTMVALSNNGGFVGMCVSYDGAHLHELRKAFIDSMKEFFNRDMSQMKDETGPGELYLDSIAVDESFRGNGIATRLIKAQISKARAMKLPATGLLVDKGNPKAERLYTKLGFKTVGEAWWGGHEMKHMQVNTSKNK